LPSKTCHQQDLLRHISPVDTTPHTRISFSCYTPRSFPHNPNPNTFNNNNNIIIMFKSTRDLKLISSDGMEYELPVAAAALSEYVVNACGRGTEEEDSDEPEPETYAAVDVLRVSSGALGKVVDFLTHYKKEPMTDIPTPLGGNSFDEVCLRLRCLRVQCSLHEYEYDSLILGSIHTFAYTNTHSLIDSYSSSTLYFLLQVMKQDWYQNFTKEDNMPREVLFEVLTAANYMTIKPLLDLCCLKVTFQLTNKSAEEVSQIQYTVIVLVGSVFIHGVSNRVACIVFFFQDFPILTHFIFYVSLSLFLQSHVQIREILNLPDLTTEEEAQAREEHRWIFEDSGN
jgi:hypothetical protein